MINKQLIKINHFHKKLIHQELFCVNCKARFEVNVSNVFLRLNLDFRKFIIVTRRKSCVESSIMKKCIYKIKMRKELLFIIAKRSGTPNAPSFYPSKMTTFDTLSSKQISSTDDVSKNS